MTDINELKDEDLEKVSGGLQTKVSAVDAGDVFIVKGSPIDGYIVLSTTEIVDNNTSIPLKKITKSVSSGWTIDGAVYNYSFGFILSFAEYSTELSGTFKL